MDGSMDEMDMREFQRLLADPDYKEARMRLRQDLIEYICEMEAKDIDREWEKLA